MSVFGAYARYYDLLYAGKDYSAEAAYVDGLIQRLRPSSTTLLELGCGTALHAALLAAKSYEIAGVDRSDFMLASAEARRRALEPEIAARIQLLEGDIRSFRVERSFDVVVSLFHVMSYQTGNRDLRDAFATARAHLEPGGLFLFDCWYGPAVLTQRPERRTLRLENDELEVTRTAEPMLHPNENVVDVNYQIDVRDKVTGRDERLHETHRMRYLFLPEIEGLLEDCGFEMVRSEEWVTGNRPGLDTWSVCIIARAL